MKKLIILLLLAVLPLVSAQSNDDFVFKQYEPVDLKVLCFNDGYCSSNAQCNISVYDPQNNIVVNNGLMTNNNSYHNLTLTASQTSVNGEYSVIGFCKEGLFSEKIDYTFFVTPSGERGVTSYYFLFLILAYGVLGLGLYKQDITITTLASFVLILFGLQIMFYGIDTFKNSLTDGISIVTLGVGSYVSLRAAYQYIT